MVLSRAFIEAAYRTTGSELLKYTRAEVAEVIESKGLEKLFTEKSYNEVVKKVMSQVDAIAKIISEMEIENSI